VSETDKLRATIAALESAGGLTYADRLEFARAAGDAGDWGLALAQVESALPLITREAVRQEYPTVRTVRSEKLESDYRRVRQAAELMRGWALVRCGHAAEGHAVFQEVEKETRFDFLGLPENALDFFYGQALLENGEYARALDRLAPAALIGGRNAEMELLQRAWRGLNGDDGDFDKYCATARKRLAPPMAEVTFASIDGGTFSTATLRGRVALLFFWFPSCSACRDELPLAEPLWRQYRDQGLSVVAIDARRDREGSTLFRREQGLSFDILENGAGDEEIVSTRFGISVFPATWLIDRRFRVRFTWDWQQQPNAGELAGHIRELLEESAEQ
jgi:peroxiredoxin